MGEQNRFSLIPEKVLRNKKLKSNEKLLYAVIYALTSKNGYCWATNKYLANYLNVSKSTIISGLKTLKEKNYISVFTQKDKETNQVKSRKIITNISIGNEEDNNNIEEEIKEEMDFL